MTRQLPLPPFFDPARVGDVWRVDYEGRAREAEEWATKHGIRAASTDESRVCLLLVDCQNTFCIPGYELFVAGRSGSGAVEDNVRLSEFIYRNLGAITTIIPTLDTHTALQIFHPIFWIDEAGNHPEGGRTVITADDVERGRWRVNPEMARSVAAGDAEWLERYARHYVQTLGNGRYPLMVWPYHAMVGGLGHALVSAIEEAVFFHSIARRTATSFEVKGNNPLTENYSALSPEVTAGPDGRAVADRNAGFVERLIAFDAVVVAGQAKSHCVAWTVHDLLEEMRSRDPRLPEKVYLLDDCTSPVVVPEVVDFTDQADAAFARFAAAGMHVVKSTDALPVWQRLEV